MRTNVKIALLSLFILSLVSFCYINFCPSTQTADATNITEMLTAESPDFNSMLPELEILEWIAKKVTPIIR